MTAARFVLILSLCSSLVRDPGIAVGQDLNLEPSSTVVAFLDSGFKEESPDLKGIKVRSFDLTGEGPRDLNGHGTAVLSIYLQASALKPSEILNIKITDREGKTDALRLLSGLKIAGENRAEIVNLSAGVWVDKKSAVPFCRKLRQIHRRYPGMLVVAAAGNVEEFPKKDDSIRFPQQAEDVDIPRDLAIKDLFDDLVWFVQEGRAKEVGELTLRLLLNLPDEKLEDKVFEIQRGVFFQTLVSGLEGEKQAAFEEKAKRIIAKYVDYPKFRKNWDIVLANESRSSGKDYYRSRNFKNAADKHRTSLEIHKKYAIKEQALLDYLHLGLSILQTEEFGPSKKELREAIALGESLGNETVVGWAKFGLAVASKKEGRFVDAREMALESMKTLDKVGVKAIDFEEWLKDLDKSQPEKQSGTSSSVPGDRK